MLKVAYKLSVAQWSVDSSTDPRTELVELDVLHEMNSPAGHCEITAYAKAAGAPGALQQVGAAASAALGAAGASPTGPSATIRGHGVAGSDVVTIELAASGLSATVATARVQAVETSLEVLTIVGRTGMQRLAEARLNQVYENQSLGQIVRDVASQAGVDVGDVEEGARYPYLVLHESRSALRPVLDLAHREGMDVYFDQQDRLTVKRFDKTRADHTFRYGADILSLAVRAGEPVASRVRVHGESPASRSGSDTWHWLVMDLGPYRGESGSGDRVRAVQDGAIRTKAAADTAAERRLAAIRGRATTARLVVLGRPTLALGDAVALQGVPGDAPSGVLKVESVRHVLSDRDGYVTVVGLTAHVGGGALTGAAGQALGALLS